MGMAFGPRKSRPLNADELLQYAVRALGGRAMSAGELRQKLEGRAEQPGDVRPVLERLRQHGYLDDRRFAEAYSTARLANEGFGKMRVLKDLRRRRVAPGLARETVDQVFEGADECALILEYLRRKYRRVVLETFLAEPRNLASAYRRLRTAGFTAGNAIHVLKRYSAQAEMLDQIEESSGEEATG